MIALSNFPTGWFQVGWSAELEPGALTPVKYFDREMVLFRGHDGAVGLIDAFCRHLGAHLGFGGTVEGDCVACPYHGWHWSAAGENTHIPYQDKPTRARLDTWTVEERHGAIFAWFDPHGGPPRGGPYALLDLFADFPDLPADEHDFYPCHPHATIDRPDEPIAVQAMVENVADTVHFNYVHKSPLAVDLAWIDTTSRLRYLMEFSWPDSDRVMLRNYGIKAGIGVGGNVFLAGDTEHRILLCGTPIDARTSHMRLSYFFKRDPESPDEMTAATHEAAAQAVVAYEQDAMIWRRQRFVRKPVFARQDVAAYTDARRWSEQFYDIPASEGPWGVIENSIDDEQQPA